jgi:hypothetical protein
MDQKTSRAIHGLIRCEGCDRNWPELVAAEGIHGPHCMWCGFDCPACAVARNRFFVILNQAGVSAYV